jgi:hypothetical protein
MKRQAIRHPKMKALARALELNRREVLGLMTLLWDFAAEYAPRGDIGRFTDGDIAEAVDWPAANAERLITALVEVGFLNRHDDHRLIVHDWHDHAEDWVKKRLKRAGLAFVTDRGCAADNGGQRRTTAATGPDNGGLPSRSPPNPRPSPAAPSEADTQPAPGSAHGREDPEGSAGTRGGKTDDSQSHGSGSRQRAGLGLGRQICRFVRQAEVSKLLKDYGVEKDEVRQKLSLRHDLTPEVVRAIWSEIQAERNVRDPAAVLVHRLNKRSYAACSAKAST